MGLFGKKKEKVVDWSEKYKLQERKLAETSKQEGSSNLGFLGSLASSSNSNSSEEYVSLGNREEKKNKLAKRLLEMTSRMEDLSNQIYHLKQRVELLEKKLRVSFE